MKRPLLAVKTSLDHAGATPLIDGLISQQTYYRRCFGRRNVRPISLLWSGGSLLSPKEIIRMTQRIWNFSAGPAVLPESVLEEAKQNLL